MKPNALRIAEIAVLGLFLSLHTPAVFADIVPTEQAATYTAPENKPALERARVQAFLDRADVKQRLVTMGVAGLVATDRVAALNDDEVRALAQKIDAMPAGGDLSGSDRIIIFLLALLILIAL